VRRVIATASGIRMLIERDLAAAQERIVVLEQRLSGVTGHPQAPASPVLTRT